MPRDRANGRIGINCVCLATAAASALAPDAGSGSSSYNGDAERSVDSVGHSSPAASGSVCSRGATDDLWRMMCESRMVSGRSWETEGMTLIVATSCECILRSGRTVYSVTTVLKDAQVAAAACLVPYDFVFT
jgi:hypothetical protein